ncbi:unnamed protein product, partial [Gulo gulo]
GPLAPVDPTPAGPASPQAPSWLLSWAWAWASWLPWRPHWRCFCTTEPGGCPPVETASGPLSRRSTPTPTPLWPRSEPRLEQLVLPPPAGGPEGLLDTEGLWGAPTRRPPCPITPPTPHRFRCSWPAPRALLRMPCILPAQGGPPNK